jgi:hypothetical protein
VDSEGEDTVAPLGCQLIHKTPAAKVVDIRRHLSVAPSEYSYFRADSLEMWAGPSHWKIKPFKGAVCLFVWIKYCWNTAVFVVDVTYIYIYIYMGVCVCCVCI